MRNDRTPNMSLALPHKENNLDDDVDRLRESLTKIDGIGGPGGAVMVGYGNGTLQQKLDNLPQELDAKGTAAQEVSTHNDNVFAHPEMRAFVTSEADRSSAAADRAETAQALGAPYPTVAAAQLDINAGIIPEGRFFGVRSLQGTSFIDEYHNVGGVATSTNKTYPAKKAIDDAIDELRDTVWKVPNDMAQVDPRIAAAIKGKNDLLAPFMINNGRLCYLDENGELQLAAPESAISTRYLYSCESMILENGETCTKIVINKESQIVKAWTEEGGYYVATSDGLKKVSGSGADEVDAQPISYATKLYTLAGMSTTRVSVDSDDNIIFIIVTWGQSLAQGWSTGGGDTLIANTLLYPDTCFMFKSPRGTGKENPNRTASPILTLEPLKETIDGGWKETACSSIASHVVSEVEAATGKRIRTLSYVAAAGGKPYMELTKGTASWDTLVQGLLDIQTICKENGWNPVVLALDVMAGESDTDSVSFMTVERYKKQLLQLDRQFNHELRRIFDQKEDALIAVSQCAFTPGSNIWDQKVRQAQYEADGLGNIRLVGPIYDKPSGDTIHINSLGQNRRGQQVARAILCEKFGTGHRPIKCVDHYWASTTELVLIFDVPRPPLVLDASDNIVKAAGLGPGLGFVFNDYTTASPTITSAAIFGASGLQVKLTLSAPTTSRKCRVGYAIKRNDGNTTQDGPVVGARGVLHDSAAFASLYEPGVSHPNWCPAFIIEV